MESSEDDSRMLIGLGVDGGKLNSGGDVGLGSGDSVELSDIAGLGFKVI